MEEDAEVVDPQHVIEAEAGKLRLRLVDGGGDGGNGSKGGKHAQTLAAASGGQQRLDEHDDHAPDREDDFRKNADVIGGCWHGYLSTVLTWTWSDGQREDAARFCPSRFRQPKRRWSSSRGWGRLP